MTNKEISRIRDVYRDYKKGGFSQAKWSEDNPGNQAILAERNKLLRTFLLGAQGFQPSYHQKILEVGCGGGKVLAGCRQWGVRPENLFGLDLQEDRVREAKIRFSGIPFLVANAEYLPFRDHNFYLVFLFTVFSSVLCSNTARNMAQEVMRVLQPEGAVVWYDFRFNNPQNLHVRGMSKRAIQNLFPGYRIKLHKVTVLPQLARRLGRWTQILYPALSIIPLLRTHYMGLIRKF